MAQPPGGGRRRLYCSNAHRAEARRRRLAGTVGAAARLMRSGRRWIGWPACSTTSAGTRPRSVRSTRSARRSRRRGPGRGTTAEILAAQRRRAAAAEEAARARDHQAAEQAAWDEQRADFEAQLEEAGAATAAARPRRPCRLPTHSTQPTSPIAVISTSATSRRHGLAAAHETDIRRLDEELDRARTAAASAEARAEEADRRAAAGS